MGDVEEQGGGIWLFMAEISVTSVDREDSGETAVHEQQGETTTSRLGDLRNTTLPIQEQL